MALPRVLCASFSCSLLSRGSSRVARSAFLSTKIVGAVSHRQLASSTRRFQEAVQNEVSVPETAQLESNQPIISDEQRAKSSRTVYIKRIPKTATRAEVEELFEKAGIEIASFAMRLNRFTFSLDRYAYIELANTQQAQQAIEKLHKTTLHFQSIVVEKIRPDFQYREPNDTLELGPYVWCDSNGIAEAVAPILERRRVVFNVKPPGWASLEQKVRSRNIENRDIVLRSLSKYGLESVGNAAVNWGDLKQRPRFLCHVDFLQTEGAEKAIRDLDKTELQGLTVGLEFTQIRSHKAHQIGLVDGGALKQLQEKKLAPSTVDMEALSKTRDEFMAAIKQAPLSDTRRRPTKRASGPR